MAATSKPVRIMNGTGKPCHGVIVPMVSPLDARFEADAAAVRTLISSFARSGVHAFVLGTTGECASLDAIQRARIVAAATEASSGRCQIHAGISGNALNDCLAHARQWQSLGADFAVAHLPSYYRIGEAAMEEWFLRLADGSPLPLLLYNIPQTTGLSLPIDAIERLASHPNICGIKDSERDESRLERLITIARSHERFSVLLGWAARSADAVAAGIDGIVPSSANLVPAAYRTLYNAAAAGRAEEAARWQQITDRITDIYQKDRPLAEAFALLKAMLAGFGICAPHCAPPLATADDAAMHEVMQTIEPFRATVIQSHPEELTVG